jgi:hypothetical protein
MTQTWKSGMLLVLGGLLVAGAFLLAGHNPAAARPEARAADTSGPRYTVVETQGHNLLVTDNGTNTVYYYATDRDAEIGSDLKLRGSVDLTQVGKPVIKINKTGK